MDVGAGVDVGEVFVGVESVPEHDIMSKGIANRNIDRIVIFFKLPPGTYKQTIIW